MESDEEDEQGFDDTCKENTFMIDVYRRYNNPKRFLQRSEKIFARGIRLNNAEASVWLDYMTDVDGCVVELNCVSGFKSIVRHITLCPSGRLSLKLLKGVLKKHVDLRSYSKNKLSLFNFCAGTQLFYEGGWECWIGLIPKEGKGNAMLAKEMVMDKTYEYLCELKNSFKKLLCEYVTQRKATRTLMKNDLNDLRRIFVLPDDSAAILEAIDTASEGFQSDIFRPVRFCFRFGEKMRNGLNMKDFDREKIAKVTVHAAVDISCDCDIDLMWSMSGIHELVGKRGTVSTCLSFIDCGNYQSNLDGRNLDVRPELLRICRYPAKVQFVQMYADLPHRKPKSRFHPVSGIIAGGMCYMKATTDAFCRDSECYLATLDSNWSLMRRSTCRLEIVSEVENLSDIIKATDIIDLEKVNELVTKTPMLVPFEPECLGFLRGLGLWITGELKVLYEQFRKTGNVEACWYAFQLELASEKLLWGRPLFNMSSRYSINLGPGVLGSSRSLTDHLGFLALEEWSSCLCDEGTIPPYSIWTRSETSGKCMLRAAGFHDYVAGKSYPVLGRRLLLALLQDLYEIGKVGTVVRCFEDFYTEMRAEKTRFQTVGAITSKSLCEILQRKRRMALHMVFGSLCDLIRKENLQLNEVLHAGLGELKLTHFPAFQTYDQHGHATLTWSWKSNYFTIVYRDERSFEPLPFSTQTYGDLVKGELERRRLIFPSKLKTICHMGPFPWISCCLQKLQGEKLDEDRTVTTLAFISCIAFIMQGWFVDYERLKDLNLDLPVSESKLKALEILSKLQLANVKFKNLTLYRLHESVSHQLPSTQAALPRVKSKDKREETDSVTEACIEGTARRIGDDEDDNILTENVDIERRDQLCKPIELTKEKWSAKELEMMHDVADTRGQKSISELYIEFREICLKNKVPFRTFPAFRFKLKRVLNVDKRESGQGMS